MSIVVDFAWSKPTVAQLQSWGAVAVGMYVSHDPAKNADLTLVSEYAAAGIKTFLFFEDYADRAAGGYAAGTADARFAYTLAGTCGKPGWAPVVPAYDFDIPDYAPDSADPLLKLGPVGQYARAWQDFNRSAGVIADAAYADYYIVKRLTAAGLCGIGVQTIAWSGGQVDLTDIALLQNGGTLAGGNVDIEIIESAALLTHLAWVPGEPSPIAPPRPQPVIIWAMWPPGVTLQQGSKGNAVRVLQTACRDSGLAGVRGVTVDGDFGPQTLTAVRNFQAHMDLAVDGIAGPETREALKALNDL